MPAPPAFGQEPASCTVARLRGPAMLLREGGSIRLTAGTAIRPDDQLVTGGKARLRVTCRGGLDVTVGADTSISMRMLAETGTAGQSLLDLIDGILRIALAPGFDRDRLELRTPTAVAAARSTEWITESRPQGTAVFAIEGNVVVTSRQTTASVLLQPGFGTDVAPDADPTPPVRWGQARVDAALDRTSPP